MKLETYLCIYQHEQPRQELKRVKEHKRISTFWTFVYTQISFDLKCIRRIRQGNGQIITTNTNQVVECFYIFTEKKIILGILLLYC